MIENFYKGGEIGTPTRFSDEGRVADPKSKASSKYSRSGKSGTCCSCTYCFYTDCS